MFFIDFLDESRIRKARALIEIQAANDAAGAVSSRLAGNSAKFAIYDQSSTIPNHLRLDGVGIFIVSSVLVFSKWHELNLFHSIALFFIIDVLGYYPSLIFSALTNGRAIPRPFYWIYNFFHSNSGGLCLVLAYLAFGGAIVNAIAIPLHYGIDRGFLRNYLKSYGTKI